MLIYKITHKIYGTSYIGKTIHTLEQRWSQHLREALSGSSRYLCRAIRKYGPDAFDIEMICEGSSQEELNELEKFCIIAFQTKKPYGYNLTDGGDGVVGWVASKAYREKMSKIMMGNTNNDGHKNFLGHSHSDESKKKIGEAGKNRVWSSESKEKISKLHTGRKRKPETVAKIKAVMVSRKGIPLTEEVRNKISASKKGKPNPKLKGRKLSEAHRASLRKGWEKRKASKDYAPPNPRKKIQ